MLKISLTKKFRNFEEKFKYFYKYRFDIDYIRYNQDKKKIKKKISKEWFKQNSNKKLLFKINLNNKTIGLIGYNLDNFLYFIVIDKKKRSLGIGTIALKKFFSKLKRKNYTVKTMIDKKNKSSLRLHKKFDFKVIKKIGKFLTLKL